MSLWLYLLVGLRSWIQRKFRGNCWTVSKLWQTGIGSSCNSVTGVHTSLSFKPCQCTQHHTYCVSKSFCLDELGDKTRCEEKNQRREVLCVCLCFLMLQFWVVLSLPCLCVLFVWVRLNLYSEGHKWCSRDVNALNCYVLHRVFFFNLPYESIMERLSQRRIDPVTGERLALMSDL